MNIVFEYIYIFFIIITIGYLVRNDYYTPLLRVYLIIYNESFPEARRRIQVLYDDSPSCLWTRDGITENRTASLEEPNKQKSGSVSNLLVYCWVGNSNFWCGIVFSHPVWSRSVVNQYVVIIWHKTAQLFYKYCLKTMCMHVLDACHFLFLLTNSAFDRRNGIKTRCVVTTTFLMSCCLAVTGMGEKFPNDRLELGNVVVVSGIVLAQPHNHSQQRHFLIL